MFLNAALHLHLWDQEIFHALLSFYKKINVYVEEKVQEEKKKNG